MNTMGWSFFRGFTWRHRKTTAARAIPFHWNRAAAPPVWKALRFSRAMEQTSASAAAIRAVEAGRMP